MNAAFIIDVALTSDFIAGFCGETEEAHQDTVDLLRRVKYNVVYCYPYSMRQVSGVKARIFLLVDFRTLLLYFSGKQKKKISNKFFLLYLQTLNIICLVEKNLF